MVLLRSVSVEYVDAEEEETIMIVMTPEDLRSPDNSKLVMLCPRTSQMIPTSVSRLKSKPACAHLDSL